jgi:SAM-dependent methyltransferase
MVPQSEFDALKKNLRGIWMAGDFGQIARYSAKEGEDFVNRLPIGPGMRVLDVACGTGNLSIPAARKGAAVTGVDIATNLLEQARERAAAEHLQAHFEEGDAEQLPCADATFDVVTSMFGAMFAPRPDRVASELIGVCRPGGVIAMANWTPTGFAGKMFAIGGRYLPPPEGVPPPVLWGDEETVRRRFGTAVSDLKMTVRTLAIYFPFPPREVVQLFREYFGPTRITFSKLDGPGQAAFAEDLERHWREHNQAEGTRTLAQAEYLEVVAVRK